jgi:hypothetical protein
MGVDPAEEHPPLSKLDSEAVIHGHRTFPSIDGPDESFDPEGRVTRIVDKKGKFCIKGFPDVFRQGVVILSEPAVELITGYFFNHSRPSSAV